MTLSMFLIFKQAIMNSWLLSHYYRHWVIIALLSSFAMGLFTSLCVIVIGRLYSYKSFLIVYPLTFLVFYICLKPLGSDDDRG